MTAPGNHSASSFQSVSLRVLGAAVLGACAWPLLRAGLQLLPFPLRFLCAWGLFTFGPGVAVAGLLIRPLDPLRRAAIVLGVGSAAAPVLINLLGRLHAVEAFPFLSAAFSAGGLALWLSRTDINHGPGWRTDLVAALVLVLFALSLGAVVFWNRLDVSDGVVLYGDYDTADLGYYAAEASEASHTVPPTASYYSGHKLNAAYFPHLVPGMINRFTGVPILHIYYRFAWPTFLALSALTGFVLVRTLASRATAVLAVVLILVGGDFSYLAAWFLPHADPNWDFVLWPTNFLSPTMEVLHFSTWGPSLPLFFTVLVAIVWGLRNRSWGWLIVASFLLAILFEFKPFAYVVTMAALGGAMVLSPGDWPVRRRLAGVIGLSVLLAAPFLWSAVTLEESDRRSRLLLDLFLLPQRMLIKLDLTHVFTETAARWAPAASMQKPLLLLMATVLFLMGGIGVRWIGAPGVWRAIRQRGGDDAAGWHVLGWAVIAGVAIPFMLATEPYVDTLQFHITGLYILWMFAAVALTNLARADPLKGAIAVVVTLALALPSSLHFLSRKWHDAEREPRVSMTREERAIAEYLRAFDPETTVVLHDRPLSPSLTTIVAARRIVLGWDVRYSAVGGEERLNDINRFYGSADRDPDAAFETLRRYHVTHVIVREDRDRVHPVVLERLRLLLRLPDVSLYAVPPP